MVDVLSKAVAKNSTISAIVLIVVIFVGLTMYTVKEVTKTQQESNAIQKGYVQEFTKLNALFVALSKEKEDLRVGLRDDVTLAINAVDTIRLKDINQEYDPPISRKLAADISQLNVILHELQGRVKK